ncbi:hypothetical protein CI109_103697 [Kwoniella shandongensis]|uniref:C2 domain-containing protein n=1 Tax=Kwoniella shandongensis TaxID=1734106 RepID=A0AAJ8LM50_9TREE
MSNTALEPKELGTLIVVVGKAKNLPNKSRFGKQDPFCTVAVGEEKQRTKPIKRGGQHPEWDEELRFAIFEDVDDVLVRSESQPDSLNASLNGAPAPLPKDTPAGVITSAALASKSRKGRLGKKGGGKTLKVTCYADDPKEPELIGECVVNFEEALKKGEVDEWYDFTHKDKYSGEIYLEMTFYSNDAPPIKRNVPRPAIHNNYGVAGGYTASPSSTLSSAGSKTRLSGGLNASGSVSGLSLYIPPYVQAQQAQGSRPPLGQVPPSNSFAELGLPANHRVNQALPQPGQPTYPPGHSPYQAVSDSIDALNRPMSSMSIGTSYSSRPLSTTPAPPSQSSMGHAYGAHRHSVGGTSEAPWGSMLPQTQPTPVPTPHPRPMSTSDATAWDTAQRLDSERLRAAATPVPRPLSGQGYTPYPGQAYTPVPQQPYQPTDHRAPSPIPPSLRPAGPPQPTLQHQPYSTGAPNPMSYPNPSPTPVPPPPSNSAPPTSPSTSTHYQMPTSSFSALTQPVHDVRRASSPGPGYHAPQTNGSYPPPDNSYPSQQTGYGGQPLRSNSYPVNQDYHHTPQPAQQPYGSAYPPQPSTHQSAPPAQNSYSYSQNPVSPARQPSPAPPQPQGNDSGYVPWYQQTQPVQPPSQPAYGQQQYNQSPQQPQYGQQTLPSHYTSPPPPLAPPVPDRRPIPQPPPPPKPQSVGYYPSDELYAQQRQDTATPQPNGWQQGHQSRPSFDGAASSYGSQQFSAAAGQSSTSTFSPPPQQYQPAYQPVPSPPHQQSWQSTGHTSDYGTARSGYAPPPQNHDQSSYYGQPPQPQQDPYQRAPSPQPPANPYHRSSSPQPPPQNPYHRTSSPQPGYDNRAPSPQPPPMQGYQPPHQGDVWQQQQQQLAPPDRSHSPMPNYSQNRTPSPQPTAKANWKSYMTNLGTGAGAGAGGIPNRTPSPQPPPKDQQWYTPPPSLPASIAPPEGWRSTLPAQTEGHAWRG